MKKRFIQVAITLFVVSLFSNYAKAQDTTKCAKRYNSLYQYGIADAFLGGVYKGELPIGQLKLKGDFGVGAPDMLDGELIACKGKVYQTKASGETIEVPDTLKTGLAFVCFFKADTSFRITDSISQKAALQQIENYLGNKNGIYAIRITGLFMHVKTRAFHPVDKEPFPALASIPDKQEFFEFNHVSGTLCGYKMPSYMGGVNISGFHFHFLSAQHNAGGHALDFSPENVLVEIAIINTFEVAIPQDKLFKDFKFKGPGEAGMTNK
jgi:acetolactate decarboxylase